MVTWAKKTFAAYASRRFTPAAAESTASVPSADGVQLSDLRRALDEMLADKRSAAPDTGGGWGGQGAFTAAGAAGLGGGGRGGNGGGGGEDERPDGFPVVFATATMNAPPPPQLRTAPPSVATATARPVVRIEEVHDTAPAPPAMPVRKADDRFGGLDPSFLTAMQEALEELGADLSSLDGVQGLAGDPGLGQRLLPLLAPRLGSGVAAAVAREMVRQWQVMMQQRMEEERELARKRQRPVWRCGACGRYGCPVAPYIERYEEL